MIAESWAPACMDADELADYRARLTRGCVDCTVTYADEMRAEGRCNGVPGELLAGVVPDEEEKLSEPVTSLSAHRLAVTVTAPCPTCAHAPVCRIRPEVESMRSLQVAQPAIDDAVSLSLAATVSCAFYVKGKAVKAPTDDRPTSSPAGRKLNLSDEERERRRNQALANVAAQRAAREAAAS